MQMKSSGGGKCGMFRLAIVMPLEVKGRVRIKWREGYLRALPS